ncbi:MAG: hypothetical protein HOP15_15700 [Planctomycetes bacterium]|nr:hypothetical protein [Planctomycetota bacterium]
MWFLLSAFPWFLTGSLGAAQVPAFKPEAFERADETGRVRVRVTETIIGFDDPGMVADSVQPSADGRRLAYVTLESGGVAVVVDGVKGEAFEGYASGSLVFSPDSKRVGYVGTRPGRQYVVIDDKVHEYDGVSKQGVVFSPDGARVGWIAARGANQIAVIDGQESSPYDGIPAPGIVFAPGGKRVAFHATSGGKHLVVLDGEEGPLFDAVAGLHFTAGGQHGVYKGLRGKGSYAVIDGTAYGPFDDLQPRPSARQTQTNDPFEVSGDGSRVGFVGRRGEEWFVVIDGQELGPYPDVALLALSPNGSRVVHVARSGEGWVTIVDGEERRGRIPDGLTFTPDSKRMAWIQKRGDQRLVQIDGVEGKVYQRIQHPGVIFSADGQHHAYLAEQGDQMFVVIDGVEGPAFRRLGKIALGFVSGGARTIYSVLRGEGEALVIDGVEGALWKSVRNPVFSADGQRYAYAAEKSSGGWVVVVDGETYGPGGKLGPEDARTYRAVGRRTPLFSPDGKRVAWSAEGEGGQMAVVDGQDGRLNEIVMASTLSFSPDGRHVVFACQREGKRRLSVDGFEIDNGWDGFRQQLDDLVWHGPERFSLRGLRAPRYLLIAVEIL